MSPELVKCEYQRGGGIRQLEGEGSPRYRGGGGIENACQRIKGAEV